MPPTSRSRCILSFGEGMYVSIAIHANHNSLDSFAVNVLREMNTNCFIGDASVLLLHQHAIRE